MRIISGMYGGRVIPVSTQLKARPTTDKAKEALFNILNNEVDYEEITVLDLFSGTGNISFEFASRGVLRISAVDIRFEHVKFIQKVAEQFKMPIKTYKADVFQFLKNASIPYQLVFADPPYEDTDYELLYEAIKTSKIVESKGMLIIEHGPHTVLEHKPEHVSTRKYGKVNFSFFEF